MQYKLTPVRSFLAFGSKPDHFLASRCRNSGAHAHLFVFLKDVACASCFAVSEVVHGELIRVRGCSFDSLQALCFYIATRHVQFTPCAHDACETEASPSPLPNGTSSDALLHGDDSCHGSHGLLPGCKPSNVQGMTMSIPCRVRPILHRRRRSRSQLQN